MEHSKDFDAISKEQLIEEFLHQEEIIQNVSGINGRLNTELVSLQLMNKRKDAKIQKLQDQMMSYVENAGANKE